MVQVTLSATGTTTTDPDITVMSPLPVGVHRIQLVVEDSSGNRSAAIEAQVTIVRSNPIPGPIPTPIPGPLPHPFPIPHPIG